MQSTVSQFWFRRQLGHHLKQWKVHWQTYVSPAPSKLNNLGFHVQETHSGPCLCTFINTLRPRQNRRHFANDIFKRIFFDENVWISIRISLKFVPKGPINNIPALVKIMAWRRSGDKPLSEPMMVSLPTHISVTRPQWVKCQGVNTMWPEQNGLYFTADIFKCISVIYWEFNDYFNRKPMMSWRHDLNEKTSIRLYCEDTLALLTIFNSSFSTSLQPLSENMQLHSFISLRFSQEC